MRPTVAACSRTARRRGPASRLRAGDGAVESPARAATQHRGRARVGPGAGGGRRHDPAPGRGSSPAPTTRRSGVGLRAARASPALEHDRTTRRRRASAASSRRQHRAAPWRVPRRTDRALVPRHTSSGSCPSPGPALSARAAAALAGAVRRCSSAGPDAAAPVEHGHRAGVGQTRRRRTGAGPRASPPPRRRRAVDRAVRRVRPTAYASAVRVQGIVGFSPPMPPIRSGPVLPAGSSSAARLARFARPAHLVAAEAATRPRTRPLRGRRGSSASTAAAPSTPPRTPAPPRCRAATTFSGTLISARRRGAATPR